MSHISSRIAISPGQPFNIDQNNVYSSVSGSWTIFGDSGYGRAVRVQGVYWSSTVVGATLQIRDIRPPNKPGVVWYDVVVVNTDPPALDMFPNNLTLFSPFQYFTSGSSGDTVIIYGEYL